MAFRTRRRPKVDPIKAVEDRAMAKALEAVKGALMQEEAVAKGSIPAKLPGSSWYNAGSTQSRLIARVSEKLNSEFKRAPDNLEVSLAEQGLTWGPPFPPGRPLDPFYGIRRPPRTWDFSVGENVQLTPRWNRISFSTLKSIYDSYDVAQICVRHLINDVRSLDYQFVPPANIAEDATDDVQKAEDFFRYPDRQRPFRAWLAKYLQDVLRFDAGTLYIRRDRANRPLALEVVSGPTIIPLVDYFGRQPHDGDDAVADVARMVAENGGTWDGHTVPAFLQIIEGMPWDWLSGDDIIYQPWNPMPDSQYGLAPLEAVLLTANTDIRFQWHFLQFFTEGTLPVGFMEAPPTLSDPAQITEWQETWDAFMMGDQAKLRQIRWVPAGAKWQPAKADADKFDSMFPLYLMRRVASAFGVTPNDLGFTEDVNRSTADTQVDVQFRVGTLPLVRHVEDLINSFIAEHLKLKAVVQFDTGREIEDRLATAQAEAVYITHGVISPDEVRMRLGKRISRERPTPRYIDNTRAGPIPLLALESLAGESDATTYGPAKGQPLIDHPFISTPGVAPVIGSASHQAAQNATEAMQYNMIAENTDDRASGHVVHPDGSVQTGPTSPEPVAPAGGTDAEKTALKALRDAVRIIDVLYERVDKDGRQGAVDNTGGPGVPRGGLNAMSGVDGVDVVGDDDEDEDEVTKSLLRQWRRNALNRVKKGQAPRRFDDVPAHLAGLIWPKLATAESVEEVNAAFAAAAKKAVAPAGA